MTSWLSGPTIAPYGDQELVNALVKANADRALLARLRASGKVMRKDGDFERRHPELARPFVRQIEDLAYPARTRGLDTIRPNKKRRKGSKR